jgi:hypothetical protein
MELIMLENAAPLDLDLKKLYPVAEEFLTYILLFILGIFILVLSIASIGLSLRLRKLYDVEEVHGAGLTLLILSATSLFTIVLTQDIVASLHPVEYVYPTSDILLLGPTPLLIGSALALTWRLRRYNPYAARPTPISSIQPLAAIALMSIGSMLILLYAILLTVTGLLVIGITGVTPMNILAMALGIANLAGAASALRQSTKLNTTTCYNCVYYVNQAGKSSLKRSIIGAFVLFITIQTQHALLTDLGLQQLAQHLADMGFTIFSTSFILLPAGTILAMRWKPAPPTAGLPPQLPLPTPTPPSTSTSPSPTQSTPPQPSPTSTPSQPPTPPTIPPPGSPMPSPPALLLNYLGPLLLLRVHMALLLGARAQPLRHGHPYLDPQLPSPLDLSV